MPCFGYVEHVTSGWTIPQIQPDSIDSIRFDHSFDRFHSIRSFSRKKSVETFFDNSLNRIESIFPRPKMKTLLGDPGFDQSKTNPTRLKKQSNSIQNSCSLKRTLNYSFYLTRQFLLSTTSTLSGVQYTVLPTIALPTYCLPLSYV